MIVFSRNVGESLIIGTVTDLTVVRIAIDEVDIKIRSGDNTDRIETVKYHGQLSVDAEIRLTVVDIRLSPNFKKMRIGIEAPPNVPVFRKELLPPN